MNNARTSSLRVPMAVALAVTLLMAGCKSDPSGPGDTVTITDTDAADLFAMAYGLHSGGLSMLLSDAVAVSRGAQFPAGTDKKGATILRDTTVVRNRSFSEGGKSYTINYNVIYDYSYTSNGFNNPKDFFFAGNKELKCLPGMKGTVTVPKVSGQDSAWAQIFYINTDSSIYTFNGKYERIGVYTLAGGKTYDGKITTALVPGVRLDSATKEIIDGDIQVSLRGESSDGKRVEWAGTYTFRIGQAPRLAVNGRYYTLDVKKGEATKQ